MFKATLAALLLGTLYLQYTAWFGDVGHFSNEQLREEIELQRQRTEVLVFRNRILTAEVLALQRDHQAVEASARQNLGMIKPGETFYLVSPEEP